MASKEHRTQKSAEDHEDYQCAEDAKGDPERRDHPDPWPADDSKELQGHKCQRGQQSDPRAGEGVGVFHDLKCQVPFKELSPQAVIFLLQPDHLGLQSSLFLSVFLFGNLQ